MFRRVYWRIAGMLMASTITLLLLIGGGVYFLLRYQLRHDEIATVKAEVPEIKQLTEGGHLTDPDGTVLRYSLDDDRGQHLYFLVTRGNKAISASTTLPASQAQVLADLSDGKSIHTLNYGGRPYLAYSQVWDYRNTSFYIVIMTSIWEQEDMLQNVLRFMLIAGGIGTLLSIASNLYLGRRALSPAIQMYNAQQDLMTDLSHEMQTPLATLNALSIQVDDDSVRKQLQAEVIHASDLVQDILYLSKLQSLPKEEREPVAVSDITEEVVQRLSLLAERNGITLIGDLEQGLFVETHPDYWKRMVSTLLKNVVDHAASPSKATWSLHRIGDDIQLLVENRVSPKHTATGYKDENFKGFGISIIYRLAEAMAGRVEIRQRDLLFSVRVIVPALTAPAD